MWCEGDRQPACSITLPYTFTGPDFTCSVQPVSFTVGLCLHMAALWQCRAWQPGVCVDTHLNCVCLLLLTCAGEFPAKADANQRSSDFYYKYFPNGGYLNSKRGEGQGALLGLWQHSGGHAGSPIMRTPDSRPPL